MRAYMHICVYIIYVYIYICIRGDAHQVQLLLLRRLYRLPGAWRSPCGLPLRRRGKAARRLGASMLFLYLVYVLYMIYAILSVLL